MQSYFLGLVRGGERQCYCEPFFGGVGVTAVSKAAIFQVGRGLGRGYNEYRQTEKTQIRVDYIGIKLTTRQAFGVKIDVVLTSMRRDNSHRRRYNIILHHMPTGNTS